MVKEGTNKVTGKKYAIKIVKKAGLTDEDKTALEAEIEILKSLQHPHIMILENNFEDGTHYYLVTELLEPRNARNSRSVALLERLLAVGIRPEDARRVAAVPPTNEFLHRLGLADTAEPVHRL